jgi:CelD/BcsL family acetyltransferase involved in cellulose biosynthesis
MVQVIGQHVNGNLFLRCVTSFDELVGLRADWLALEDEAAADLPFQTWEWAVAWWKHLHEESRGVRDYLRIFVVRNACGRVIAIAPFILTERPAFGPLRIRYLQLIGADPNITEIRTLICLPGMQRQVVDLLRAHIASRADQCDWIAWEGLQESGAVVAAAADSTQERSAFVLSLASDWGAMRARFGRNLKESLRKCYNSLGRDGLRCSLETLQETAEVDAALAEFFRLHSERASLKQGPRHADVFASCEARAFLIEVMHRLAQRGVARVFRLQINGRVVAIRLGFEMCGSLYLYYSGWDPKYGHYSIMTTLLAEIVKDAIRRGLATINLSTGSDMSKTRWRPQEVVYSSHKEISPRAAARVRYYGFRAVRVAGGGRIARELVPRSLTRRSEPRWTKLLRVGPDR